MQQVVKFQTTYTAVDTGATAEPPLVPLTDSLATHYLAARTEVMAFIQKDTALLASMDTYSQHYTFTLNGPGGAAQATQEIILPDFTALAAKIPAVAAIFKKHAFAPSQFAPVTITIRKALFADALHRVKGWPIKDPASITGKNIVFVDAHHDEFAASGLDYEIHG